MTNTTLPQDFTDFHRLKSIKKSPLQHVRVTFTGGRGSLNIKGDIFLAVR